MRKSLIGTKTLDIALRKAIEAPELPVQPSVGYQKPGVVPRTLLGEIETDIRIYEDKQGKIMKFSPKAIFAYALVFIYYSLITYRLS